MADLFPNLSRSILPRLGQDIATDGGIRQWLIKGGYQASPLSSGTEVTLENVSTEELVRYIAFDYERFALSSWESFCLSPLDGAQHQLVGWPLLKLYYSGFFAAHAILRCGGQGVVKLESAQAETLRGVIEIVTGSAPDLKAGMYIYSVNENASGQVSMVLKPYVEGGGVHESFWRYFASYLEALSKDAVSKGSPDAASFLAGVSEITPLLKRGAGKNSVWYSAIRNEINYQHLHGVWYPPKKAKINTSAINAVKLLGSSSVRLDYSATTAPLNAFLNLSQYLACLNYELAEYISARSTAARHFGSNWRRLKAVF